MAETTSIGKLVMELVSNDAGFRKGLQGAMQHAERNLKRAGAKFTKVGGKLSAAVTAPLAGIGTISAKMAADFDKGMREVNTLLGLSEKDFASLKMEIRDVSKTLGTDLMGNVQAAYQAISAGIPKEELTEFLKVANKAAIAGIASTESAVKVLTKTMDAYGTKSVSAAVLSDQLFATVKGGVTTFEELAAALPNAAGQAASLNVTQAELLGILARTTKVSGTTSEAVTRIASAMSALQKKNESMFALQKKAGIANFAKEIEQSGLFETLLKLREAADGNEDFLAAAFGRKEALLLLNDLAQNTDAWRESMDAVRESAGATDQAFAIMDEGTSREIERAKAALRDLAITLGDVLLPMVTPIIEKLGEMVSKLGDADPRLVRLGVVFGIVAAAIGPVVLGIGLFIKALGVAAGVVGAIVGAISLPVVAALGAIVAVGAIVVAKWNEIKAAAIALKDRVVASFNEWREKNSEVLATLKQRFVEFWDAVKTVFDALFEAAKEIGKTIFEELNKILEPVGGVEGALHKLGTIALEVLTKLIEFATEAAKFIAKHLPTVVEHIKIVIRFVSDLIQKFRDAAKFVVEAVRNLADGVVKHLGRVAAPVKAAIGGIQKLEGAFGWLRDRVVGNSHVPDMVDGLIAEAHRMQGGWVEPSITGIEMLDNAFENFADRTADYLTNAGGQWKSFGDVVKSVLRDLANELVRSGIRSGLQSIFGGLGGSPGGGLLQGILGSFGGGPTNRASFGILGAIRSILPFADGGRPPVGRASLVGERGPELFVPDTAGMIVPNHMLGGGGITLHHHFEHGITEAELARILPSFKSETIDALFDLVQRGGAARRRVQT